AQPAAFTQTPATTRVAPTNDCGTIASSPALILSSLRRNRLAIGGLPAPGTGTVAALGDAILIDLRNDLAVAGGQRLGRAHLGAERQLSFGQPIGAVLGEFGLAAVDLRAAGAIGAFVHLAARAEVPDTRILRRAERAGVEAIAAADAEVLGVQHDTVGGGIEAVDRTHCRAGRVGAVHACHRDRALARLAVVDRHDPPPIDAPWYLVLVLARGDAGVALDATVGVTKEFHSSHDTALSHAALIWQSVALGSCMPVTGSNP